MYVTHIYIYLRADGTVCQTMRRWSCSAVKYAQNIAETRSVTNTLTQTGDAVEQSEFGSITFKTERLIYLDH